MLKSFFQAITAIIALIAVSTLSASAQNFPQEPQQLEVHAEKLSIVRDGADEPSVVYDIEIAQTLEQLQRGMMFRTDFPLDRAMLFVFPDEKMRGFWMENTPLSLDIVFADSEGRVVHVARNAEPLSRDIIGSHYAAKYALEVRAGQAGEYDIRRGDLMVHPVIGQQ